MRLRFFLGGFDKFPSDTTCSAVPRVGEMVALDGQVREVAEVRWDFWSSDAEPVANVFLLERPRVRGPKPLRKTRGKST